MVYKNRPFASHTNTSSWWPLLTMNKYSVDRKEAILVTEMFLWLRISQFNFSVLGFTCKFLGLIEPTVQLPTASVSQDALWFRLLPSHIESTNNKADHWEGSACAYKVYLQLPGAGQVGTKSIIIFVVRKLEHLPPTHPHTHFMPLKELLIFCLSSGPGGKIFCLSKGFFHKQVILFKWVPLTMFINL